MDKVENRLQLPLGAVTTNPMQMAQAYGTFANEKSRMMPTSLLRSKMLVLSGQEPQPPT